MVNIVNQALTPYLGEPDVVPAEQILETSSPTLSPFLGNNTAFPIGTVRKKFNVEKQALKQDLSPTLSILYSTPLPPAPPAGAPLVYSTPVPVPDAPLVTPSLVVPTNPSIINVTPVGNFETQPSQAEQDYVIGKVVDAATKGAPTSTTTTLMLTMAPGSYSLDAFGIDLAGKSLKFVTGGPYVNTSNVRTIILAQGLVIFVPNQDANGNSFDWAGSRGPGPGVIIEFDTARSDSENVFAPGAPLQVTIPAFTAAPTGAPPLVSPTSPEFVDVMDQELTNGFPQIVNIV